MHAQPLRLIDGQLRGPHAGEDAVQRVVVALADGIKLVIVAARARGRESLKRFRDDIDLAVHGLDLFVECIDGIEAVLDKPEVCEAEQRFVDALGFIPARLRQQVAREMFADELIPRHVGVAGADEVIAIAPRVRNLRVALAAVRLGETHQVHPMPRPVFAKARGTQQPSDNFRVGVRRGVIEKHAHLFGSRRQAGQSERDSTKERPTVGGCGGLKPALLHLREKKLIHGMRRPRRVRHGGHGDFLHRLETPPVFARSECCLPRHVVGRRHGRRIVARVQGAIVHPFHEVRDDGITELGPILGHGRIGIVVPDRLDEPTLPRVAGDERGTGVTALEQAIAEIHAQLALLLLRAVALVAFGGQQRADALLEEFKLRGRGRERRHGRQPGQKRESHPAPHHCRH